MAVTIAFTDSANGGGFAVTVSGSPVSSQNTLYYQAITDTGSGTWQTFDDRTGDGAITGTLAPGYYWFHAVSQDVSVGDPQPAPTLSNILGPCAVTRDPLALHERFLAGLQANLQAAIAGFPADPTVGSGASALTTGRIIRFDEFDPQKHELLNSVGLPCIIIAPGQTVGPGELKGTNERDPHGYPADVFIADVKAPTEKARGPRILLWEDRIVKLLNNRRLSGVSEIVKCTAERRLVMDHERNEGGPLAFGWVTVTGHAKEARGI